MLDIEQRAECRSVPNLYSLIDTLTPFEIVDLDFIFIFLFLDSD